MSNKKENEKLPKEIDLNENLEKGQGASKSEQKKYSNLTGDDVNAHDIGRRGYQPNNPLDTSTPPPSRDENTEE
jgi:hypothetical protein